MTCNQYCMYIINETILTMHTTGKTEINNGPTMYRENAECIWEPRLTGINYTVLDATVYKCSCQTIHHQHILELQTMQKWEIPKYSPIFPDSLHQTLASVDTLHHICSFCITAQRKYAIFTKINHFADISMTINRYFTLPGHSDYSGPRFTKHLTIYCKIIIPLGYSKIK